MMKIAYLGPKGSYSSCLAEQLYPNAAEVSFVALASFVEVCDFVLQDRNRIGLLPVENSTTSNVHENIELIFSNNLHIVGESYLAIALHLFGLEGASEATIDSVYSHPKALQQCSSWIHSKNLKQYSVASTAAARDIVIAKANPHIALIGGSILESSSELQCLARNIGNEKRNLTRFVSISKDPLNSEHCTQLNKMSFLFSTPHVSGALAKVLLALADTGINLTKIESSPIPGSDFEYRFWIDVELNGATESHAIQILQSTTKDHRIIGHYKSGNIFES